MNTCVLMYAHTHMSTLLYTHLFDATCSEKQNMKCTCIHQFLHICAKSIQKYVHICAHIRIFTCMHTHICMYSDATLASGHVMGWLRLVGSFKS